MNTKQTVEVNDVNSTIDIPHWGVTLRTLFGAALAAQSSPRPGECRDYTVQHKEKPIAVITVRQHNEPLKGK